MFGHQKKYRLLCRFLQYLQQFIGRGSIHLLGLPDDHDLIAVAIGLETQFMQNLPTLFLIDHRLLILDTQGLVPIIQIEIMIGQYDLPPCVQEGVAYLIGANYREDEMQIRMLEFFKLETSRTGSATVLVRTMGTVKILRIRQRQLELSDTRYAREKLCMRDSSLTHILAKQTLRLFLPYDLFEEQSDFSIQLSALCATQLPSRRTRHPSDRLYPGSFGTCRRNPARLHISEPSGNEDDSVYPNRHRS